MFRRPTSNDRTLGQAMVEFALILPVLALLLVMAVDFGRVFFGWVAVTNASRIGANEAARNPTPWSEGGTDELYYRRIAQDLSVVNCDADVDDDGDIDADDLPEPVFTDQVDDVSDPYEVGDHVTVTLNCAFATLTPLAAMIVGNPITIGAESTFTIFGGEINGIPVPSEAPTQSCLAGEAEAPDLVGVSVATARTNWSAAGFTGSFSPEPGPDDDATVTAQTTNPASTPGSCLTTSASVLVTTDPAEECVAPEIAVPNLIGMTVADARSAWFGAGFDADTFNPSTGGDSDIVDSQSTSTGAGPGSCSAPDTTVTVTYSAAPTPAPTSCEAPQMIGLTPANAESAYRTAGFTGTFSATPKDKPTWKVKSQSLVGGQPYACTANLEVQLENR